jgi:NADH-quinone oxidoreductase subunit F
MDEDTCMVDIARYFLSFTCFESCGKCTPCRLGTKQMFEILERICNGEGRMEDIDMLLELAKTIKYGSLCGFGESAPNTVLTTLRYFVMSTRQILKHRCRAAVLPGDGQSSCIHTCRGNRCSRYIRFIERGTAKKRWQSSRKDSFPSVCGLVCFHPVNECRRVHG